MKMYVTMFILFFCSVSFAQSSISGKVTDGTDQPIPGANVNIVGDSNGTVTDFTGAFELKTKTPFPLTIEVSMLGFATQTVEVKSKEQELIIVLVSESTRLNEIVVAASRAPERLIESPVTIERMGLKDIKNTTSATFYEGLENLKEVHFNTSSFNFKSINTRGFASIANTRFLQLVDGMDNASPALNFVLGNLIGISDLDVGSVEVLPGASSALYGANAFNGIMFMNSRSPFTKEGISSYFKYGQTSQKTAGTNEFYDFGIRAAKKFTSFFAGKANFTYLKAREWIASDFESATPGGDSHDLNPNYDGLNIYGDEVSTNIKDVGLSLAALGLVPANAVNLLPNSNVSRTGYREQDVSSNKIDNVKADFSAHFKPWAGSATEFILQYKVGLGNTIYQGANRYQLKDFFMDQMRFEVKGKNFFARVYRTNEDAGKSYDTRFTAWNVNRSWKDDKTWFGQYAGSYISSTLAGLTPDQAHATARKTADTGRFEPGSPDFIKAFNKVIADDDFTTGSKFKDRSRLLHSDVNYNLKDLVKFGEIQVGGSARQYSLNSDGSIFTDYDGPITYNEYGVYTQLQKKFNDDRAKLTASIRYDKSQNFKGNFSPRVSLTYALGANKQHNMRASYQTGFRNPTTQDQYIGLDLGPFALIGSAPDNLDRYNETRSISTSGSLSGFVPAGTTTINLSGQNAYYQSYTSTSVQEFAAAPKNNQAQLQAAADLLKVATPGLVKPERVQAIEVGYRSVVKNFGIDLSGYYNIYNDFLNTANVITPYYGNVNTKIDVNNPSTLGTVSALSNGDRRVFQVYTNSKTQIKSLGFGIGLSRKIYKEFELSANYSFSEFEFDQASDPSFEAGFNTPKHRLKASLGNERLFKHFGFNTNVRWNNAYLWQSSFGDGIVPENVVFDAQINYAIPSFKSVFKVGGANLFGKDYIQVIGAGAIGQQWYASWTINP
jgi:iron complex outermembrane recepter protein